MPLNVMDAHHRSFAAQVVPRLVAEGVGVLGMKPLANGIILRSKTVSARECLRYALHLPTSVVITGMDSMERLEQVCEVADSFTAMTDAEVSALLGKTAAAARDGAFEPFKTATIFDSTAEHPEWLGEERAHVQALMQG